MQSSEYWARIVKPLIARFEREPTSIELAFAACTALNHVTDYLPLIISDRRSWIENDNEYFPVIFAIASAAKHLVASDARHGELRGLRADSADIGTGAAFDDGTYFDDGTSFDDIEDVVRVRKPDGSLIDLLWLLKTVSAAVESKLLNSEFSTCPLTSPAT